VWLGVRAAASVSSISCDWQETSDAGATRSSTFGLTEGPEDAPRTGVSTRIDGHLAEMQTRGVTDQGAWGVRIGPVRTGVVYRYRFHATASDGHRRTSRWFEFRAGRWETSGGELRIAGQDLVLADSIEWWDDGTGPTRVRFSLPLQADERVVGFGERFDRLDQRGHALDAVVFEQYKAQGELGRTYLPMPFAHVVRSSGEGWGFHLRTQARTWYDIDHTTPSRLVIEAELDGRPSLDVTIWSGDPYRVLTGFLDECGRAEELPDWVFGLWASDNEWNTQAAVLEQVDRHRAEGIPVGAVVIEAWSDESTFTAFRDAQFEVSGDGSPHRLSDFTFPPDGAWPDPAGMVDELHRRGIRVVLWQIPLIKMRPHPTGQALADEQAAVGHGYVIAEADGRPYRNRGPWFPLALMPDLTDPEAALWWTEKRRYLVDEVGIDGFKTDGGEHAWGHDLGYRNGSAGASSNNIFPVAYVGAYGDLLRRCGRAPVTFSRAGFAGSQPHGIFWAGDEDSTWLAMRHSILAGLTASSCGIVYWSWDLAGFSGPVPDPDLYLRAAAVSTFTPVMQYHAEFNAHRRPLRARTPWNVAEVSGDSRVLPAFRRLIELRGALRPYLARQAGRAVREDRPLMRPLFFDHRSDAEIWNWPLEFQLGDDLLVAPVTEPGVESWQSYLPVGEWVEAWTGERFKGGQTVITASPLGQIPVFSRASAWAGLSAMFSGQS
jgi:alpha-glucosidase (family GH31 glycosyl hydrolase)